MEAGTMPRGCPRLRVWLALGSLLALVLCGCQAKEPPLSPGALQFKNEIKACIKKLQASLVEPLAQKDLQAIHNTLKEVEPEALKLCRMCPFQIGVLNHQGYTLTVYPPKKDASSNFSNYDVVIQALNNRQTTHQRFFLQDHSQLYIVCAPVLRGDQVLGLVALAIGAADAEQRWGLTAPEFLAIDFNR